MKLNSVKNELTTNAQFTSQEFGIGNASVVIEILRNRLYKFKIRTLVQEYISNARDATREIKSKRPIEVTIPNRMDLMFKVRDFGPGITPERMATVFVMYGASTKRDTNNQTGGFGIGAKSAWSYTDSFVITTITDGEKRVYIAHTGVNNQGRLDHVSTEPSTEPTGTEIQIAVKPSDLTEFTRSIHRAIYFWEESEQPKLVGPTSDTFRFNKKGEMIGQLERVDGVKVPDFVDWEFYSYAENKEPIAVIDGIIYPLNELMDKVPSLINLKKSLNSKIVLHFKNGVLEVSAARESLSDSEDSVKNLDEICKKTMLKVKEYVKGKFSENKSLNEYISTFENLCKDFNLELFDHSFNKFTLHVYGNSEFTITHPTLFNHVSLIRKHYYGTGWSTQNKKTSKLKSDEIKGVRNGVLLKYIKSMFWRISGDKLDNKRIAKYLETNDNLIIVEKSPNLEIGQFQLFKDFVKELNVGSFKALPVDVVKRERSTRVSTAGQISVKIYRSSGKYSENITLSLLERPYVYILANKDIEPYDMRQLGDWLISYTDKRLCVISSKVHSKIKDHSMFIPLEKFINDFKVEKKHINWFKKQSAKNVNTINALKKSIKKFDDKFIVDLINEYDFGSTERLPKLLNSKVIQDEVVKFETKDRAFRKVMKRKYELMWIFLTSTSDDDRPKFVSKYLEAM